MDKDLYRIIAVLRQCAQNPSYDKFLEDDTFSIYEWSGGNVDDAYELGRSHGGASLARTLLQLINDKGTNNG